MTRATPWLRVSLAAGAAILVAVAGLGVASSLLVGHQLRDSLDRDLRTRGVEVARLAASAPSLLPAPGALDTPSGGRQLAVEVVDRYDRILARSDALGGHLIPGGPLLDGALHRGASGYRTATLAGAPVRVYAVPVADTGGAASGGAVLVSSTTSTIADTERHIRGVIALAAVVASVLGAALAAALVRRGLSPVRRLATAARAIASSGDAAARLPDPVGRGEVADLAGSLNTMLGALDRARTRERRFLADASHELRTPLTSLRGNVAHLVEHGADAEVLADLEHDADRLARLVDGLLALEREGEATAPGVSVDLRALVAAAARRGGAGTGRLDAGTVAGDELALERMLDNLISNGRRHGPSGGAVTVELRCADGVARIAVSDEGPGPAIAERDAVFERFWRSPDAAGREGSGLGLALVRAVAARHGGHVGVEGSRFTVELPLETT